MTIVYVVVTHAVFLNEDNSNGPETGEVSALAFYEEADALSYMALDVDMNQELFTCPVVG